LDRKPATDNKAKLESPSNNENNNSQYSTDITDEEERKSKEIPLVSKFSINNYFSNSKFPLPLFDENSVNPVLLLQQLDIYTKLKVIPNECRLTVAYRSLNGVLSKQ
jgi:hypothetical protein